MPLNAWSAPVDRMYQKARFVSDHERLTVLLDRHAAITAL